MIYTKLFSRKYRTWFKVCALTILFAFSLTLYSCQTVTEESFKTEEFEKLVNPHDGEIIELETTDSIYSSEKYSMEYKSKIGTAPSYFTLAKMDTILVKSSPQKMIKVIKTLSELKTAEVNRIKVEHTKIDAGYTAILGFCIVAVTTVILILSGAFDLEFSQSNFSK